MQKTDPKISVILPVFNAQNYIKESIKSILNQDFKDFELIIVDDGSTDDSLSVIKSFNDSRIRLISRDNKGLVKSLNEAIEAAKGEYIARMDADDISMPDRLSKTLAYMQQNSLDLCGSFITKFHSNGGGYDSCEHEKLTKHYTKDANIKVALCYSNPLSHPSIMAKASVLKQNPYPNEKAEDLALWCALAQKGIKIANIPQSLLKYRIHQEQITKSSKQAVSQSADKSCKMYMQNILNALNIDTKEPIKGLGNMLEISKKLNGLEFLGQKPDKIPLNKLKMKVFNEFDKNSSIFCKLLLRLFRFYLKIYNKLGDKKALYK